MKTTIKLYIHQLPGGPQEALTCNMSEYSATWGALLGTVDVEVEWKEIDRDPREALIESLESQVEKERADSQVRVNHLLDQISKLKCLEHVVEVSA